VPPSHTVTASHFQRCDKVYLLNSLETCTDVFAVYTKFQDLHNLFAILYRALVIGIL